MKKLLKILLILILVVVVGVVGLLGFLTVTEYRPDAVETLEIRQLDEGEPVPANSLTVMSWNIGYAGLGREQDFFMDGGTHSKPGSNELVNRYLSGIAATIEQQNPDLVLLQEVDTDSSRTFGIDETTALAKNSAVHALNYSCPFVPIPFPPMGKVHSGLFTTTDLAVNEAQRVSLPCPFSWPLSTANLKRCLLVSRHPVMGTNQELVLVNLHLEAYDSGEGKIEQTKRLMNLIQEEYEKGNFVIAGGDFNQLFPGAAEAWPNTHEDLWSPGTLDFADLPAGFGYVYDLAVPSCRLLNQPFDPADTVNTQYYVIDGFIVSPNVELDHVNTLDLGFACSDHNPVVMQVNLVK